MDLLELVVRVADLRDDVGMRPVLPLLVVGLPRWTGLGFVGPLESLGIRLA